MWMGLSDHARRSRLLPPPAPTMAFSLDVGLLFWLFSLSGSSHGMVEGLLPMSHAVIRLWMDVDDQSSSYCCWCRQYLGLFAVWISRYLAPPSLSREGRAFAITTGQEGSSLVLPLVRVFGGEGSDVGRQDDEEFMLSRFRSPCSGEPLRGASLSQPCQSSPVCLWGGCVWLLFPLSWV
jgi:hypothetical protein